MYTNYVFRSLRFSEMSTVNPDPRVVSIDHQDPQFMQRERTDELGVGVAVGVDPRVVQNLADDPPPSSTFSKKKQKIKILSTFSCPKFEP